MTLPSSISKKFKFWSLSLLLLPAIASFTCRIPDRNALQRHAETIERGSHAGIKEELDLQAVKERYLIAVKAIAQP